MQINKDSKISIEEKIKLTYSPEQVANRLKEEKYILKQHTTGFIKDI